MLTEKASMNERPDICTIFEGSIPTHQKRKRICTSIINMMMSGHSYANICYVILSLYENPYIDPLQVFEIVRVKHFYFLSSCSSVDHEMLYSPIVSYHFLILLLK